MADDVTYLHDILTAAERIESYLADRSADQFDVDPLRQDAVLYRLAVIGEAAKLLSANLKLSRPEIPWRKIVAMRNILVHDYGGVDVSVAYRTAVVHVPELVAVVRPLHEELSRPPAGETGSA